MQMPKPTEDDKHRFRSLVPDGPQVEVKPMFGNLGAFVNGNMFMGLLGADVGLRLNELDRQLLRSEGGGPFGPGERPMAEYVSLPPDWLADPFRCELWVAKALDHARRMPAKEKSGKAKPGGA